MIFLILGIGGFFLPFLWFLLAIYVAYLIIFKKQRQKKIITLKIRYMLRNYISNMDFDDLYFEAVASFLRDNNGYIAYDDYGKIVYGSIEYNISGKEINVSFLRISPMLGGGTNISIQ